MMNNIRSVFVTLVLTACTIFQGISPTSAVVSPAIETEQLVVNETLTQNEENYTLHECIACLGKGEEECEDCLGYGYNECGGCVDGYVWESCSKCRGTGTRICSLCNGKEYKEERVTCSTCNGSKTINGEKCAKCAGHGTYILKTKIYCNCDVDECSTCKGLGGKYVYCDYCNGTNEDPCYTCNKTGYVTCHSCHGLKFAYRVYRPNMNCYEQISLSKSLIKKLISVNEDGIYICPSCGTNPDSECLTCQGNSFIAIDCDQCEVEYYRRYCHNCNDFKYIFKNRTKDKN